MSQVVFVLLMSLLLGSDHLVQVASYNLTIRPDHLRVSDQPQNITFGCYADMSFNGCQFRWLDHWGRVGPLLELSRGSQSQADPAHLTSTLTGYRYSGRGLGAGDCGVSLQVKRYKKWLVACRVRAESGGWKYAWVDLFAAGLDALPHTLATPREAVVLPGGEARFLMKVEEPLDACSFNIAAMQRDVVLSRGAESAHSTGRYRYLGAGLQIGECGLALTNISEADNGPVRGWMLSRAWSLKTAWMKGDHRYMSIIVASAPGSAPTLHLEYTRSDVTATCEVQESRPRASISWFLGDDIIREDSDDDSQARTQDEWRWPWTMGAIKQTLTLQLRPQHNGIDLTCRVSHVALVEPLYATEVVTFT